MNKANHGFGNSMDASLQEDSSSLQLSLPESIDDSLTIDGFPIIPSHGSTAEARLYFAQLQESIRKIERLEQDQSKCLDAIQNGRTPTDDEFESIRRKPFHELSFQELFWKIVYDAVLRHKQHLDIQEQNTQNSVTQSQPQGIEHQSPGFHAQCKIQELQATLLEIKEKYLRAEKESSFNEDDKEFQKLKRLNEELHYDCEKHQRSLIQCKSNSLELERKIHVLEQENSSLIREKEQYILKLDRSEEECRKKDDELYETMTKLEHMGKYSMMLQTAGFEDGKILVPTGLPKESQTHLAWAYEKGDVSKPLEMKINQLQCELHERKIDYAKLEILYDERGKQVKESNSQVYMLQEQLNVLKREFENLEKESLLECKRLNDEIIRRDEQLDMYLDSKMSYDDSPLKEDAEATTLQSPSKLKSVPRYCECSHCRHLLAHAVVLGKKCKELHIKINELETRSIQQQATAETNATALRYKSTIHTLENRVADLQKKNDAMRLEYECMYNMDKRSVPKDNTSTSHAIHHMFIVPQRKDAKKCDYDVKSIHLEYRGPGSFRVG